MSDLRQQITELERLATAATPGPWECRIIGS